MATVKQKNDSILKRVAAVTLFLGTWLLTSLSCGQYGITWDEPEGFFEGVFMLDKWVETIHTEWQRGHLLDAFSEKVTHSYWEPPTERTQKIDYYNNHPPLNRFLGLLTFYLFRDTFGATLAMRLSATAVYALMVAVIFLWASEISWLGGLLAALFTLTLPRLFAFGHFLTTDIFLTSIWVITAYAFWQAIQKERIFIYIIAWLLFGAALNTKFTALLIPIPIGIYLLVSKRGQLLKWLISAPFCLPSLYLMNPTLWHHPLETFINNYFLLHVLRTTYFNPSVFYCGVIMQLAPWHYPLLQTLITVPVIHLLFFLSAIYLWIRQRVLDELSQFAMFNFLTMLIVVSLPGTPKYDGVRLFLPAFPFLAVVAAITAQTAVVHIKTEMQRRWSRSTVSIAAGGIMLTVVGYLLYPLWSYHPYQLSYYNEFIGGLRGAYRSGMEATYWLEAVTPRMIASVNRQLPKGASLALYPPGPPIMEYYQRTKVLRSDLQVSDVEDSTYVIWVNRRSAGSEPALQYFMHNRVLLHGVRLKGVLLAALIGPP